MVVTFFGRESPAVRHLVGRHIACSGVQGGRVCDPFGQQIGLARLPGGHHQACHQAIADMLFSEAFSAGVVGFEEPARLFQSVIPVSILGDRDGQGRPPAIIPDASLSVSLRPRVGRRDPSTTANGQRSRRPDGASQHRDWLVDVKTLHGGGSMYRSARAASEQSGAVEERAYQVQQEYERHARHMDDRLQQMGHAAAGETPVQQRLRQLGPIRGLAFGQYAEASTDVHELIAVIAQHRATREWRRLGARSVEESRAFFIASLRRTVGVFVARQMARHRLQRAPMVGLTRQQLDESISRRRMQLDAARNPRVIASVHTDFFGYQAWVPHSLETA